MNKLQYLDFFKRKAKRLLKDYKKYLSNDCIYLEPSILLSTMIEKFGDKATLINAQHIVAQSAGFKKWEELIQAGVLPTDYDFESHKELVPMQKGDVEVTYADTTPLERDYNFKPTTPLREGLKNFAEWYKEFYK